MTALRRVARSTRNDSVMVRVSFGAPRSVPAMTLRAASSASKIRLALLASASSVRSADLADLVAVAEELAGEPSAVAAGAFDAPGLDLAVPAAPFPEPAQPGRCGGDAAGVEPTTVLVEDDRDVDVFVGVDAEHKLGRAGHR